MKAKKVFEFTRGGKIVDTMSSIGKFRPFKIGDCIIIMKALGGATEKDSNHKSWWYKEANYFFSIRQYVALEYVGISSKGENLLLFEDILDSSKYKKQFIFNKDWFLDKENSHLWNRINKQELLDYKKNYDESKGK